MGKALTLIIAAATTFTFALGAGLNGFGAERNAIPDPILKEWTANEAVFAAPENHHFNLEAPNKSFKTGDESRTPLPLKMKEREARVVLSGAKPGDRIRAELFLCDDAKTFCVRRAVEKTVPELPKKKALKSG